MNAGKRIVSGDYTHLAKHYLHRAGYSRLVLDLLGKYVGAAGSPIADVGAGTGKLTEDLLALGFRNIVAVEPNCAMRKQGEKSIGSAPVIWKKGSAERTGLRTGSVQWLLMGSSFHWTATGKALKEFNRVLRPGGYCTVLWNPRVIQGFPLHEEIEDLIKSMGPTLKRKSSGVGEFTEHLFETLVSGGWFRNVVYVEACHDVDMTPERFIGLWKSVNDVQSQLGPKKWRDLMVRIEEMTRNNKTITTRYRTRAWTVRRLESRNA